MFPSTTQETSLFDDTWEVPAGSLASRAPLPGHELAGHCQRKDALLSPAERAFYRELKAALSREHEVS